MWSSDTAVVSLGATREFTFRTAVVHQQAQRRPPPVVHYPYLVANGDVCRMFGDCQVGCWSQRRAVGPSLHARRRLRHPIPKQRPSPFGLPQERFQHCIRVEKDPGHASPRMSLVFKLRL